MAQEIDLGGTIYISSKHAAEKTGYTQDYIGQLARGGQIEAKRISGMWYILEESLRNYKAKADQFVPTPPQGFTAHTAIETSVSFDGKDYISTSRAAKLTGYNQDYVGQLARSGEVLSRQVGNRWYVDRESLMNHKKEKDDLLAAVQVQSVGLAKPGEEVANTETRQGPALPQPEATEKPIDTAPEEEVTHFEYVHENKAELIPNIPPASIIPELEVEEPEPMPEFPRRKVATPEFEEYREAASEPIAIRKIHEQVPEPKPSEMSIKKGEMHESAPHPEVVLERQEVVENRTQEPVIRKAYVPKPETIPWHAPEPEVYTDSLDDALSGTVSDHIAAATITETAVVSHVRKPRKAGKGGVFAIAGITVAAALGTVAYIGSTLGFFNVGSIISLPQSAQNASVANSIVENNVSSAQEMLRNLFSKELVYKRQ